MMGSKGFKKSLIAILLLASMFGVFLSKQFIDIDYSIMDTAYIEKMEAINPKLIQPFLFGHEGFYADLFWIHSIRWSVERGVQGLTTYIVNILNLVTDLDPRFEQAYICGASAITFSYSSEMNQVQRIKAANKLLHKGWDYIQNDAQGWKHYPSYWMIPQILSFNYGFELKDREKALEYNHALMSVPNLPVQLKTWAAGLYRNSEKADQREKGLNFLENLLAVETLQSQLNMTDDEVVKERLRGKMVAFYNRLKTQGNADQRIDMIQQQVREIVQAWRSNYKFIPFPMYVLLHGQQHDEIGAEIYPLFFPNLTRGDHG